MTKPVQITLAGYQGPGSVHTRGLEMLREALVARLGNRVEVVLQPNVAQAGHKTADLPALTESGEVTACYISSSYLAERVPALSLFDMPFAAPTRARTFSLLDGALGARFGEEIKAHTGLTLLGIWDNGIRHLASAAKPLRAPQDCQGLSLRTLPNADHQTIFRALGFSPQVIDAKDLAQAVAAGQVDAHENPLTNTYNFDLHKTLPTITLTGHLMGIALLLVNRQWFQDLPQDIRQAMTAAALKASRQQRALAAQEDAVSARALEAAGATLFELTPAEHAAWRKAAEPEVARSRARLDAELLTMFDSDLKEEGRALV